MLNKMDRIKIIALIILLIEIALALLFEFILKINYSFLAYVFIAANFVFLIYIFLIMELDKRKRTVDINRVLGTEAKEALEYGMVGIIIYDEKYIVTWASDFFENRKINIIGEKITKVFPEMATIFSGNNHRAVITDEDGTKFECIKEEGSQVVFVKDITEIYDLKKAYQNEKIVLGLISLDNYEETIRNEDEQKIAQINTNIRQRIVSWAINNGAIIRRIRSDRFFVVINYENFKNMLNSRFEILNEIKDKARNLNVSITSSMAYSYGDASFDELDSTLNSMLELVLSRGGDQVAVKQHGKEVEFFGHSSEASEKTSKVRARVMSQSLEKIFNESSDVFIIPHNEADLDSFGACLGISRIVFSLGKKAYIVFNGINIEPVTEAIYEENIMSLIENHIFISEEEALSFMDEESLVVAVDHHSLDLTSTPRLVEKAEKIVIIDHHRRKSETNISAMLIYNEPSASSTVELVTELMQYSQNVIELSELEATIMYAGILVDTDELKTRTNARTFEACATLKKSGSNTALAYYWLKEGIQDFIDKTTISKHVEIVREGIAVSAVKKEEKYLSRTALAKGANHICSIKGIQAAFVIAQIDSNTFAISARSNGQINVQIIMEKMGGGGHFNAAGLQRTNTSLKALKEELILIIEQYQQGGSSDESNPID
ncbi:MAG: DHH family phosphoesterase [Bacillota bacterium]|jgi:c-di-AMP phosphodiesterase-like protein|nr:DHH family phosphoesterase [Bacillota bacterium]NLL27118.1 DHH family phosphoesterase [Erysipelotrichia bacterium]